MKIGIDKNQKANKHEEKHNALKSMGHELVSLACPVGDYIKITPEIEEVIRRRGDKLTKMDLIGLIKVSVDTKRNCEEIYADLIQDHARFSDSQFLAHNNGIKLIILIENEEGIRSLDEFQNWRNEKRWKQYFAMCRRAERNGTKKPKPPVPAITLKKMMITEHEKYGTEFIFCGKNEVASKIVELLNEVV